MEAVMLNKIKILIIASFLIIIILGCESKNGILNDTSELPLDNSLNLYSENEGIFPDKTVLDNPNNPFANANVNMENIWDIYDECPSPKSAFYLWATILAKAPTGEYQYYTALSLHKLYTVGGSENAREQAKKAYRSALDHFFNSTTWYEAWWIDDETSYAVLIKDLVGQNLYDPSKMNLTPLYDDPVKALADLSEWGYILNTDNMTISKSE